MKLSEAIRLGAMMKPQAFGLISSDGGTCAIGAAYDAIGKLATDGFYFEQLREVFPIIHILQAAGGGCPGCSAALNRPCDEWVIPHLNDEHGWTRERIADWVETVELAQEAKTHQPEQIGQAQ